jgi:hypothetical protein
MVSLSLYGLSASFLRKVEQQKKPPKAKNR